MTSSIDKIVQGITDSQKSQIKLTTKGGNQVSLNCIYKEDIAPYFYLIFPPETLPDNIDEAENHPVSVQDTNSTISLNSTIVEQKGDRKLHLIAKATIDPASLREFFRVNITIPICASYEPSYKGTKTIGWTIKGQTQDLSGSGVLALFKDEPKNKDNIFIELAIPQIKNKIRVIGHIIRKKLLRNRKWQVSFQFDNISNKHRDTIITTLLKEQRRQLRENVQAWD